ncbi:hypothetical protein GJ496_010182 [Pomphorhynchus laevis]|nr:hypothetical protein GJ496_010182 [Pomphorhynchus laevis]
MADSTNKGGITNIQVLKLLKAVDDDDIDTVKKICKFGDQNIANIGDNNTGITALMLAAEKNRLSIIEYLINDEIKADHSIVDIEGKTALMYASRVGCNEAVSLLLDYGADVIWKDHNGKDALHHALQSFCTDVHGSVVSLLLSYGGNPESVDNFGKVALIEACRDCSEHENAALVLVAHSLDLNIISQV